MLMLTWLFPFVFLTLFGDSAHAMVPTSSIKFLWKCPQRYYQRWVYKVTPNPVAWIKTITTMIIRTTLRQRNLRRMNKLGSTPQWVQRTYLFLPFKGLLFSLLSSITWPVSPPSSHLSPSIPFLSDPFLLLFPLEMYRPPRDINQSWQIKLQ